jgi:F-type H+-transporting ATPase subunit gamma
MEDIERVETRLENIQSVKPILGALRTISLGTWQSAQKQRQEVRQYTERLLGVLAHLLPHLSAAGGRRTAPRGGLLVALVVGGERGLAGRFNDDVVNRAQDYLTEQEEPVEWMALGKRAVRLLERAGFPLGWTRSLSATALPSEQLAMALTEDWLRRYEAGEIDAVDLIYNAYLGAGRYRPSVERLIPPQLPPIGAGEAWPPPIIETDPLSLYARVIGHWAAAGLYERLLESAAAEHSTRYQRMESATENAEDLIEELNAAVLDSRQEVITREMQELIAGAGMLG